MFVRMFKKNSEHKIVVKYVTKEIGEILVKKEKAEIIEGAELVRLEKEKSLEENELMEDPEFVKAKAKSEDLREKAKVTAKKAIANADLNDKIKALKKG